MRPDFQSCGPAASGPLDTAEVAIVGAGLAGASAAWFLAPQYDVVLVEQAEQAAAEASGQNAGMLRRLVADPVDRALACRSLEYFRDLPGGDWPESPVRWTGGLCASTGPMPALDRAAEDLRRRGIPVERLTAAQVSKRLPAAAGIQLEAGWFVPEDGTADPWTLARGFLNGARRRGARLHLNSATHRLCLDGHRVVGVETSRGRIDASQVVIAAGAWSRALGRRFGRPQPVQPYARHLLHSAPHPLAGPQDPWFWIEDAGLYLRPESGGWLCSPCDGDPAEPPPGAGSLLPVEPEGLTLLADKLSRVLPEVAQMRIRGGWRGLRSFAPDRRPIIGPDPEVSGLWWAVGLGGSGVTCSFAVGDLLRARFEGQDPPWIDAAALDPGRPDLAPPPAKETPSPLSR